jgi:hypothetical protein
MSAFTSAQIAFYLQKREAQRLAEEAREAAKNKRSTIELKTQLLRYLQPHETVAQAMRRLSGKPSHGRK